MDISWPKSCCPVGLRDRAGVLASGMSEGLGSGDFSHCMCSRVGATTISPEGTGDSCGWKKATTAQSLFSIADWGWEVR